MGEIGYGCSAFRGGGMTSDGKYYVAGGDGRHLQVFDLGALSGISSVNPLINKLTITPNPAQDKITVSINDHEEIHQIEILSISGKQL